MTMWSRWISKKSSVSSDTGHSPFKKSNVSSDTGHSPFKKSSVSSDTGHSPFKYIRRHFSASPKKRQLLSDCSKLSLDSELTTLTYCKNIPSVNDHITVACYNNERCLTTTTCCDNDPAITLPPHADFTSNKMEYAMTMSCHSNDLDYILCDREKKVDKVDPPMMRRRDKTKPLDWSNPSDYIDLSTLIQQQPVVMSSNADYIDYNTLIRMNTENHDKNASNKEPVESLAKASLDKTSLDKVSLDKVLLDKVSLECHSPDEQHSSTDDDYTDFEYVRTTSTNSGQDTDSGYKSRGSNSPGFCRLLSLNEDDGHFSFPSVSLELLATTGRDTANKPSVLNNQALSARDGPNNQALSARDGPNNQALSARDGLNNQALSARDGLNNQALSVRDGFTVLNCEAPSARDRFTVLNSQASSACCRSGSASVCNRLHQCKVSECETCDVTAGTSSTHDTYTPVCKERQAGTKEIREKQPTPDDYTLFKKVNQQQQHGDVSSHDYTMFNKAQQQQQQGDVSSDDYTTFNKRER